MDQAITAEPGEQASRTADSARKGDALHDGLWLLRRRYLLLGHRIRLILGLLTLAMVLYATVRNLLDVPLAWVVPVLLYGTFSGFVHIPLLERFPGRFVFLLNLFLLIDYAWFTALFAFFGPPYTYFLVFLFVFHILYAGAVGEPVASIYFALLGGLIVVALGFLHPASFAWPTLSDPTGLRFRTLYVLGTVAYLTFLGVLAYFLVQTLYDQRSELARQSAALWETNAELRERNEQLGAASRYQSEFLTTISHELRTPLNSILGFSSVLLRGIEGPLREGQEEDLRRIEKSGHYLLSLVNDILDMAKIEAGELALVRERVDMGEVAAEAMELMAPEFDRKGLSVSLDLPRAGEARVLADRRRIKQIILNLLSNAVKFTPEGEVRLQVRDAEGNVQVDVSDTGIGVRPEDRPYIFNAFRQSSESQSGRPWGTGLGLSIARHLVELHGGEIWVQSIPGQGATFSFALPKAAGEALIEEEEASTR